MKIRVINAAAAAGVFILILPLCGGCVSLIIKLFFPAGEGKSFLLFRFAAAAVGDILRLAAWGFLNCFAAAAAWGIFRACGAGEIY